MANKRKLKKSKPPQSKRRQFAEDAQVEESRGAVAANVAWMLSLMATLAAEVVGVACQFYLGLVQQLEIVRVLGAVMLVVALVCGVVTLVLIPVVLKVTKTRPPSLIVQVAAMAGVLPLITLLLRAYVGQ